MALRDRIKGALSGKKSKDQKPDAKAPDDEKSTVKHYTLDRNQCWAVLMARVDSAHELAEYDWFGPTIQKLIEMELVLTQERDDETVWRLTGMGENFADYLSKAGIRLTISGDQGIL